MQVLASGILPSLRHDGSELDPIRQALAGAVLDFLCALVLMKGDWSEYCHTFGLTSWNHVMHC